MERVNATMQAGSAGAAQREKAAALCSSTGTTQRGKVVTACNGRVTEAGSAGAAQREKAAALCSSAGAAQHEKVATACNGRVTEAGRGLRNGEKLAVRGEHTNSKREGCTAAGEGLSAQAQKAGRVTRKPLQAGRWFGTATVALLTFFAFGMLADEGHEATLTEFLLQKLAGVLAVGAAWIIGRAMTVRGYWPDMLMHED